MHRHRACFSKGFCNCKIYDVFVAKQFWLNEIQYESFIARAGSSVYVNNNLAAYTAGGGISLVQPLLQIVCTSSGLRMIGEKLIRKSSNRAFAPSNLLETIKFLLFYHYNKILHVCMMKNPILQGQKNVQNKFILECWLKWSKFYGFLFAVDSRRNQVRV